MVVEADVEVMYEVHRWVGTMSGCVVITVHVDGATIGSYAAFGWLVSVMLVR